MIRVLTLAALMAAPIPAVAQSVIIGGWTEPGFEGKGEPMLAPGESVDAQKMADLFGDNAETLAENADASMAAAALAQAGWNEEFVDSALAAYKDEKISLVRLTEKPGVVSFMVAPKNLSLPVTNFKAGGTTEFVQPAFWGGAPSAEEIRDTIMNGLQLAIQGVCQMPGNLKEIKAKASAAGFVEVEATWEPEGVCEE